MKKYLLLTILSISVLIANSQSLNFGIEFMQRNNKLSGTQSYLSDADYNNAYFHVMDRTNDTLGVNFNRFKVSNNFELPLYLRYKFKKRFTVDINFSTSKYNITLDGTSNYNERFFTTSGYYLTQDEFVQGGYGDSTQYTSYLTTNKNNEESEVEYIEKFKLTTLGTNISYSFSPHKLIRPYVFAGLGYRSKSKQYSYDEIDVRSKWLLNKQYLSDGVVKFAKNSYQFRFGGGVETYRFRAGFSWDYNFNGEYTILNDSKKNVYQKTGKTPYENLSSFSFFISADLLTKNLSAKKQLNTNTDVLSIDKLELKKNRHQFGIRMQKVGASKVNDYDYAKKPLTFVNANYAFQGENYTKDSVTSRAYIQSISFRGISLVDFSPKFEGFYKLTFFKKFEWESSLGWQRLTVDMKTRESDESYIYTSQNYSNGDYYETYTPDYNKCRVFSGAYRSQYGIINIDQAINYTIIEDDFIKLKASAGLSFNYFSKELIGRTTDKNSNSLDLSRTIDDVYISNSELTTEKSENTYVTTDDINVDFKPLYEYYYEYASNTEVYETESDYNTKLNANNKFSVWKSKYSTNDYITTFRFGLDAEIDRFSFGINYEKSLGKGDGLIIKDFSRLNFSISYILYRK